MFIDHEVQLSILRELLFHPRARFSQLNQTDLTNDHFTFHLTHLIKNGLVEKVNDLYNLTSQGLEIAGRLDIKTLQFVRQPKVGVAVFVTRRFRGQPQVLVGRRLKDPSFGKAGMFFAEKVRIGESLLETAARCLDSEVGVKASYKYMGAKHVIRYQSGQLVQDVVFTCFRARIISGKVLPATAESQNSWIDLSHINSVPDVFEDLIEDVELIGHSKPFFLERTFGQ